MLEIKVTIEAPELSAAINNLAKAFEQGATADARSVVQGAQATKTQTGEAIVSPPVQETAQPVQETAQPVQNTPVVNIPAPEQVATPEAQQAPVAEKKYTLEELSNAGARLVDAGKMPQIMQLINKYGVQAINQLNPAVYGEFAKDLIALGAKF